MAEFEGTQEGTEVQEGSQGTEQGSVDQGQQQIQQQHDEGKFIPRERFDKVYGQFAEYKKFGKITDLQAKLAKYEQYEKAIAEHRAKSQETDENKAIKERLYQVAPELKALLDSSGKIGTIEQQLAELREQTVSQRMDKASEYFSGKLKELGFQVTKEEQEDLEKLIWYRLNDDQKQEFVNGDFSVIDDYINKSGKTGVFGRLSAVKTIPKAPVRMGSQGAPQQGKDNKPKTLAEAGSPAWEQFINAE
jgi:hypothetical protein